MRRVALLAPVLLLFPGCIVTAVLSADAELTFPDRGDHVVADGLRLRYVERGAGRPIVLLHGAFSGLEDWEATLLEGASLRGRAIAFDRPGQGWSDPPCRPSTPDAPARSLRDACREIGAERPVLVGFSYGGAVAAAWASRWPDEVAGLLLLAAPTHPWHGDTEFAYDIAGRVLVGDLFVWNFAAPAGRLLGPGAAARVFAPEAVPAAFDGAPYPMSLRPGAFRANAEDVRLLDAALADQSARYPGISCPVVFVVGDGDCIVGPEFHAPRFAAQVPQTRRVVVARAGHQLPYAHGDVCLDALDAVLAEGPEATPAEVQR